MNREERDSLIEYFWRLRESLGRTYTVSSVDTVHCKEDLLAWKYTDHLWWIYKLNKCKYTVDILMNTELTIHEMKLFTYIGERVTYNNVSYFDSVDAMQQCDFKKTVFKESMKGLEEKGYLVSHYNQLEKRTDRLVSVSPTCYWLGDYTTRNGYIQDWCIGKGYNPDIDIDNLMLMGKIV